ncbi:MAG: type II secretion system protein GspC [Bdellovibrionota bacterium]
MNAEYIEYVVERQQKIANMVGTILVAWILSALVCSFIGLFLPSPSPIAAARASVDSSTAAPAFDPMQRNIAFYMPICERNLFDSAKQSSCDNRPAFSPIQDESPQFDSDADPVKSSINAKLLGTMVSTNDKFSFATVSEGGKKEPETYKIGDLISGIAKIYAIERNRVYFTNAGRKEYLEVDRLPNIYRTPQPSTAAPAASSGVKVDGNKVTISKAKVDSTLQDLNQVIQQARMVPNYENGQVDGFKVFGIRSGSIFQDLGLQNGDVINNINGTQIDSLEKALPMLQLLKTESSYTIDITRKGAKQTMSINIQ